MDTIRTQVFIKTTEAPIYDQMDKTATVLTTLHKGDELKSSGVLTTMNGYWRKVTLDDGQFGYVLNNDVVDPARQKMIVWGFGAIFAFLVLGIFMANNGFAWLDNSDSTAVYIINALLQGIGYTILYFIVVAGIFQGIVNDKGRYAGQRVEIGIEHEVNPLHKFFAPIAFMIGTGMGLFHIELMSLLGAILILVVVILSGYAVASNTKG